MAPSFLQALDVVPTRFSWGEQDLDGDMPPRHSFWTKKSGRKITEMEATNPGNNSISINLIYLFIVDIDGRKSNYWGKFE